MNEFETLEIDAPEDGDARPMAYIRALSKDEIARTPNGAQHDALYAVHDENGMPLALFSDRAAAVALTRMHQYTPVSVH
ncbi:MAG: DUF1150 family protein [Pseudomonadota bacterium]